MKCCFILTCCCLLTLRLVLSRWCWNDILYHIKLLVNKRNMWSHQFDVKNPFWCISHLQLFLPVILSVHLPGLCPTHSTHLPFMEHLTQWQADIILWHTFLSWNTWHNGRLTSSYGTPPFHGTPDTMAGWHLPVAHLPFMEHQTWEQADFILFYTFL